MEPGKFYSNRIVEVNEMLSSAKKSSQKMVVFRALSFLFLAASIYFVFSVDVYWGIVSLLMLVLFLLLMKKHEALKQKINYYKALITLNGAELKALDYNYSDFYNGQEFDVPEHSYLQDLDIFGPGSVFQYINRTATLTGRQSLAADFINPPLEKHVIEGQQLALEELAQIPLWRQDLQALLYLHPENELQKANLLNWVQEPKHILRAKFQRLLLFLIPATTFLLLVLAIAGIVPFIYFLLYFIAVPLGYTGFKIKEINRIHRLASEYYPTLEKYAELLRLIEEREWESDLAKSIKSQLQLENTTASGEIKRLSDLISKLDQRLNILAALFLNGFLLWDLRICKRIGEWQGQNSANLPVQINAIGKMDALVSLATFTFNHPQFCRPQLKEGELFIKASELSHFLLHPKERVSNSLTVEGWQQLIIITGANMAGKSTFLRTLGLNLVLARLGLPVCASEFVFTPVQVFTAMRTKDSLQKHESYFFAELKRLQKMIGQLKKGEELFIILDEMLKGTNSKDQHLGSVGLIEQLLKYKASGMIATHDLLLGKLAEEHPRNIRNMRFEIEIENGQMQFDYKLKPGISRNLNASFLMKQMGITE